MDLIEKLKQRSVIDNLTSKDLSNIVNKENNFLRRI